jgi:hypothetical protein
MTWLTWRQFRAQAAAAAVALAAFAVLLAVTGPHLASLYRSDGVAGCHGGGCTQPASNFLDDASGYTLLYVLGMAVILLAPAVIGIFWGAPLIAREFETGTFRLAWTQTTTRTRWLAAKLALPGLAAVAVTAGLSLMFGWWAAPIGQAARLASNGGFPIGMGPFSPPAFATHGVTPLGYAAFAFTLGVTAGLLLRRAIPAMAVTLGVFAIVQVVMPLGIRPHLFPAAHTSVAVSSFGPSFNGGIHVSRGSFTFTVRDLPGKPGAWVLAVATVNAAGQRGNAVPACRRGGLGCLIGHGIKADVSYQPASRYWPLQGAETAIYLVLALGLAGYCSWRLRRRLD